MERPSPVAKKAMVSSAVASRTEAQLRHHYLVERELAQRLLNSTREERPALFESIYDEMFRRVPDHPRLVRRENPEQSRRHVEARMRLLSGFLKPQTVFLEFAPGDCRLAYEVCRHVKRVVAVDISDQRAKDDEVPDNFELIVYDGYNLNLPDESADVVFSYQFLEHLHPEDFDPHLEQVMRLLVPGGAYIFDTPHALSGPHDISRYFSETAEGFHFKEWTYGEMMPALAKSGFSRAFTFRGGRARLSVSVNFITLGVERFVGSLSRKLSHRISRRIFSSVAVIAFK